MEVVGARRGLTRIEARASTPLSAVPRAFLRWAGSKRLVLEQIVGLLPDEFDTYYEPFLGGGSLFFMLEPDKAVLGDSCSELVSMYNAVKDSPETVLGYLSDMKPDEETYYAIRSKRSSGRLKRAAEFIYLNMTCWNGLYRVNSKGQFNVPYGRPKSDYIMDPENLRACASVLSSSHVKICLSDFEETVSSAGDGDFVFFDPPYVTGHKNNGFVDYNEVLFSWADQLRLAEVAHALRDRGVYVIVTNADHAAIEELYPTFEFTRFNRKSTISSATQRRSRTSELAMVGRPSSGTSKAGSD